MPARKEQTAATDVCQEDRMQGDATMLILSVRHGDTTTITTPGGETISILTLNRNNRSSEVRLGITAPDDYQILRDALRKQLQVEFQNTPIYRVSSAQHPTRIIADSGWESAIRNYQRYYPDSTEIRARLIEDRYRHRWYKALEDNWMRDSELPVSMEIVEV